VRAVTPLHPSPPRGGACTPDPLTLAAAFGAWFLEVESGRRSRTQLEHLLHPLLYATLAPAWVRPGAPGRVLRAVGTRTAPDRYDAVLVVRRGERVGALAVSLQRRHSRWRVERAVRPEDGVLSPPSYAVADDEPDIFDLVGGCMEAAEELDGGGTVPGCPTGRHRPRLRMVQPADVG